MMKSIVDIHDLTTHCTGCRACEQICPRNCIVMDKDNEGFIYPQIKYEMCINCGKCKDACHVSRDFVTSRLADRYAYYCWAEDEIRDASSSGGAFSKIVECFLSGTGYVFGAAFSDDWYRVHHIKCDSFNYSPIRKSKYMFSDIERTYIQAKEHLDNNEKVVFAGTPCQISGLKCYLKNNYNNLFTIDFICHGVSSEEFFKGHLKFLFGTEKLDCIDFRPARSGWDPVLKVILNNGHVVQYDQIHDFYLYSYFHNLSLRKSCYYCHYTNNNHQSDITLADFWKAKEVDSELLKQPGVSLVICNTEKGKELFECIKFIEKKNLPIDKFSYVYNKEHSRYSIDVRSQFYNDLYRYGLERMEKRFKRKTQIYDAKTQIKSVIKHIIGKKG